MKHNQCEKRCPKCEEVKSLSKFGKKKTTGDGLQYWCKSCMNEATKIYQRTEEGKATHKRADKRYWRTEKGKDTRKRAYKKHYDTILGYLRKVYSNLKHRCNNPECRNYNNYGGHGIKCLFKSSQEFADYVINNLNIASIEQIKGLEIDRINNDGHYEPGNIRFVTPKENSNNKNRAG